MTPPYSFTFRHSFHHAPRPLGAFHIHTPEHIQRVHRLGAPFFEIDRVFPPKLGSRVSSVEFECSTMGVPMHVFMSSRNDPFSSQLVFNRKGTKDKAFLKLGFRIKPDTCTHPFWIPMGMPWNLNVWPKRTVKQGHVLEIDFQFWNPLLLLFYPWLPLFVWINSHEDDTYFRDSVRHNSFGHVHDVFLSVYREHVLGKPDDLI